MKYRKKPVVIEATQWWKNGDHPEDKVGETFQPVEGETQLVERQEGAIVRYFRDADPAYCGQCHCKECSNTFHVHGWIDTLEGGHIVCPGDWIITGVKGERYPCKPDIFALTYDAVDMTEGALLGKSEQREVGDQRILADEPLGIGISRR